MEDLLRIGVVTSPHGVKGEVKVYPTTDDLNRFRQVKRLLVDTKKAEIPMDIQSVKYFKNMVIVKLSGITSRDDAENYRNADLLIRRSESPVEEGRYLICDLLDMRVMTEDGETYGTLTDVLETSGANFVYEVTKNDGKTVLLPAIPLCIRKVDVAKKEMTVSILPGLED